MVLTQTLAGWHGPSVCHMWLIGIPVFGLSTDRLGVTNIGLGFLTW